MEAARYSIGTLICVVLRLTSSSAAAAICHTAKRCEISLLYARAKIFRNGLEIVLPLAPIHPTGSASQKTSCQSHPGDQSPPRDAAFRRQFPESLRSHFPAQIVCQARHQGRELRVLPIL